MKKTMFAALAAMFATAAAFADGSFTYMVRSDGKVVLTAFTKSTGGAVIVPAEVNGRKVVSLQGTFNGCKKVTSISVPASVTEIGDFTFQNTTKLKTLKFDAASTGVSVGAYAFKQSGLKDLALPAGSTVDDFAFYSSKIATLEVKDDDPMTKLYNIDDFLSPYNAYGVIMSKIKTLIVPCGCVGAYSPYLSHYLYGRKAKHRGVVRAQYPRVFAVKRYDGDVYKGTGYFKVGGKKVANGTPVKPGTKVQFVATAAAGYTPQYIYYADETCPAVFADKASEDFLATWSFKMPQKDRYCQASFIDLSEEVNWIDSFADFLALMAKVSAIKGKTAVNQAVFHKSFKVTQLTVSAKGLPKGLALSLDSDGYYYVKGTPKESLDYDNAPAYIVLKGASGYMRAFKFPVEVLGGPAVTSTVTVNTDNSPNYNNNILAVLSGMSYSKESQLVLISSTKKMSVTASGLPKGIKLSKVSNSAYTLAGRPTAPGVYVATFKVKVGGKTETHRIAFEVRNNPLAGSYRGYLASKKLGCGATTMTVGVDGKATLTFTEGKTQTKVTGYPSFETGFAWDSGLKTSDSAKALNGRFRYTFSVPKDSKRKLGKRTVKLAYFTDNASGITASARIRQGPIAGFSLDQVETLRLFPVMPAAQARKHAFYTSKYKRDYGGFSLLIGSSDSDTYGKGFYASADYNYESGKVALVGRLPAGKAFSSSLPLVASCYAYNDAWDHTEKSYRAIEAAPLVVTDTDGEVYVIKIPTDPSEFYNNLGSGHDAVGLYSQNRFGEGLFGRWSGAYSFNNSKDTLASARTIVSASPKVKFAFENVQWTSATVLSSTVTSSAIDVGGGGKIDYEFDKYTGLWKFDFVYNGLVYTFEGTPAGSSAFAGVIGRSSDGKKWTWGAAKVE